MKKTIILLLLMSMSLLLTRGLYAAVPVIVDNRGLVLYEGSDKEITRVSLDVGFDQSLIYKIVHPPFNGYLRVRGVSADSSTTFTQQDIVDGLISYEHDGSDTIIDYFVFSVSNLSNEIIYGPTFDITIIPQDDSPVLVNNSPLYVENCYTGLIDEALLLAKDSDTGTIEISFVIETLPSNGILYVDSEEAFSGTTFNQQDIGRGAITYVPNCSDTSTTDYFTFSIYDDLTDNYDILGQMFEIIIINEESLRAELNQCQTELDQCLNPTQIQPEGKGKTCFDGIDNDGDSLIDCADPGCSQSKKCI